VIQAESSEARKTAMEDRRKGNQTAIRRVGDTATELAKTIRPLDWGNRNFMQSKLESIHRACF
jgi:hypothetical protein